MQTFDELMSTIDERPFHGYYVRHDNGQHSISDLSLISHVEDNLYVGGCMNGVDLGDFFGYVFSMYKWEKYKVSPSTAVHTVTMYDSHDGPEPAEIADLGSRVASALDTGENVLVHCQAGINRSNLVAAAALIQRGRTPDEAINLLRERRHKAVLANSTFERFVRGL